MFNAEKIKNECVAWIRNFFENNGKGCNAVLGISGGKDSMLLAKLMQMLQRHSDFPFEVKFLVMDPGYTPENREKIRYNKGIT